IHTATPVAEAATAVLAVSYLLEAASGAVVAAAPPPERNIAELLDLAHPRNLRDVLNTESVGRGSPAGLPPE
ncbi:hypothetical protein R3Q06_35515, partial [Rhodococcus erythropolis]|uniref:hypothetical protein n=1 Tax=Rhodococcus erythropolis TaxID=1833 RepID=UPI002948E8D0